MTAALLVSVLLIAACGLIYELVAGTLASYLLGDSVTQFSTVIGTYLFAMGIGSWLSRFVGRGLVARFILVELMVGVVGGFSSAMLFLAFAYTSAFRLLLYALVLVIGILVGLEIPLLMRLLRDRFQFKDVVANVLTFDYLGALGASLLFPIVLVPKLGLVRAPMLFGAVNVARRAVVDVRAARRRSRPRCARSLQATCVVALALLGVGLWKANAILDLAEANLYADDVVLSRTTPYQRIVMTAWKDDLRLFLNANLQFSSRDEYRYHEALVHPGLAALPSAARVLDPRRRRRTRAARGAALPGRAARDARRSRSGDDAAVLDAPRAAAAQSTTRLIDPRVTVVNADAFAWLDTPGEPFDFAVVDFPDPSNFSLGKLYTTTFYRMLMRAADARRHVRRAVHVAAVRAAGLLVHRRDDRAGGPRAWRPITSTCRRSASGASCWPGASPPGVPTTLPAGLRFLTVAGAAGAVRLPRRHGARARGAQSPAHAGAGALLRARVERDQQMNRRGYRVRGPGYGDREPFARR